MPAADFPDWSTGAVLISGSVFNLTAADFPDWTDGVNVVDGTIPPNADFPDWTKVVGQVAGITPPNPSGALATWYDASRIAGPHNGDSLASWADSSTNHFDLNTHTGTEPLYINPGVNGLPAVQFIGGSLAEAGTHHVAATITVGAVIVPATGVNLIAEAGDGQWQLTAHAGVVTMAAAGNANTLTGTWVGMNKAHSVVAQWDLTGGTWTLFLDGTQVAQANNGGSSQSGDTGYIVGAGTNPPPSFSAICEVLIYSTILSAGDVASLHTYLAAKWASL